MRQLVLGLMLAATWVLPAPARANPYDISLRGLGRPRSNIWKGSDADPANVRYANLTSELVFALAPRPLAPAETLGISGFEFSIASTTADINDSAAYWQGQPGLPVFEGVLPSHGEKGVPTAFWVPTVHLRKGLPMSAELGINATYLAWSEMTMLGVDGKVALHESYFRWVPAIAVRGSVSRLFGSSDLDIVAFEADLMASLPFGIGGMVQVTPFAGFGLWWAHVNSQVLDETPYNVSTLDSNGDELDQKGGDPGSLYTFPTLEWNENQHSRVFFGARLTVAMMEVIYELDIGIFGGQAGTSATRPGTLTTHTFKLGFDV